MQNETTTQVGEAKTKGFVKWLKRLGFAGFMFFFLKGIAWLVLLYFGGKGISELLPG